MSNRDIIPQNTSALQIRNQEQEIPLGRVAELWLGSIANENTRAHYERAINLWIEWMYIQGIAGLGELSVEAISNWAQDMRKQVTIRRRDGRPHGLAASTVAGYMVAVRGLLTFAFTAGLCPVHPAMVEAFAKSPKVPQSESREWLSKDEINRLLGAAKNLRDRTMFIVLCGTGVRVSELVRIRLGHFHTAEDRVIFEIPEAKGGKARSFVIPDAVFEAVGLYVADSGRSYARAADRDTYLFQSRQGGGLTESRIFQIVQEASIRAGIAKKVSPHVLRHTFATHYRLAGGEMEALQHILGHSRIETTMIYDHIARQLTEAPWHADWLPTPANE